MNDRLMKSRAEWADAESAAGISAGRKWAETHAEYADLRAASVAALSGGAVAADVARVIGRDAAELFGEDSENLSSEFCIAFFATLKVAYCDVEESAESAAG